MSRVVAVDDHPGEYLFYCPGCNAAHAVSTTTPNGMGATWGFNGNLDKPTFHPSILCTWPGNVCHSYITDGQIAFLTDCTHALAGQTVELPDFQNHMQ